MKTIGQAVERVAESLGAKLAEWRTKGFSVPTYDFSDPDCVALYERYASAYNGLMEQLEERGAEDLGDKVRDLVGTMEDLQVYVERNVYFKGMIDGMLFWMMFERRKSGKDSPTPRVG